MKKGTIANILKAAGGMVLRNVFPPLGGMAFEAINAVVDEKLSEDTTGEQAEAAVSKLPPEQKASLLEKQLDVEMLKETEFTERMRILGDVDKTGMSTRPKIAQQMAYLVIGSTGSFVFALIVSILLNKTGMVKELKDAWPVVLAILGTPTTLLIHYFGKRTKEKEKRYELAGAPAAIGWLGQIISAVKGK
jgi:hypothetical protein